MAIALPLWYQLKQNIKVQLQDIATEEAAVSSGRDFEVSVDRWRPWIEEQQKKALVNIMVDTVGTDGDRSSQRRSSLDAVVVKVDMYAIGEAGQILPADAVAAERLDLLVAQVREGLTRLLFADFGFSKDPDKGFPIDRDLNFDLNYYDQEGEQATGQYAPARWSFTVKMPFIPVDDRDYDDLEELNIAVSDESLELFAMRFNYTT